MAEKSKSILSCNLTEFIAISVDGLVIHVKRVTCPQRMVTSRVADG
jgi:hypothetical protein